VSREPTRVHLTVDVECRAEHRRGEEVEPSFGYDERVWGRLANHREELGLGRVMSEIESRGFKATFFVDPLGSLTFGREGLREICRTILDRGHDLQLHLHPSLRHARWLSHGQPSLPDDMSDYGEAEQAALLQEGLHLLQEAGMDRRRVVAFRAGNFAADQTTWRAMARVGLSVSSNYDPCYFVPASIVRTDAAAGLFPTGVPGVVELPITCFAQKDDADPDSLRHLQIGAVSAAEMIDCLEQSRRLQVPHVTIVTHPFEFFYLDARDPPRGRVNHINLRRLRRVLDHLAARRGDFTVQVVRDVAREAPPILAEAKPFLVGRRSLRLRRYAEQALKRLTRKLRSPQVWVRTLAVRRS